MTGIVSTNIISPSGFTTEQNFSSVREGGTALKVLRDWNGIPGQICAGAFSDEQKGALSIEGHTFFESIAIRSIRDAVDGTGVDLSSERTGLILSTTKGNIDALGSTPERDGNYSAPGTAAKNIATCLGITTDPVVVCNACISGVTAQVIGDRLISAGLFDTVIVCGADVLSTFCIAGFISFRALSPHPCRPFDIDRLGLNIGECAATMVLRKTDAASSAGYGWKMVSSFLNNDAYHVSAPSPSGDGVLRAIKGTVPEELYPSLATICVHGTATMFNDQMESKAIAGAGLSDVPVSAFKGCLGHTFGAAGVAESILAMKAVDDGVIPPVMGFEKIGVSGKINISGLSRNTDKTSFLKIISGFGGCNGAILYSKDNVISGKKRVERKFSTVRGVRILPGLVEINGENIPYGSRGPALLTEIFKTFPPEMSRYYKMDHFSRLVYVATGLLLKDGIAGTAPEEVSMILFNRSSSVVADRLHIGTYRDSSGFFPSPSVFLNTLPNVVMGEVAVRHGIKGETTLIILPDRNDRVMNGIVAASLAESPCSALITGWVNFDDDNTFEADLKLMTYSK